jgi:signal transduction histidine kinase
VLFNLVGNAIKFTFKGFIKISLDIIENALVTTVEDSGIGIKEDDQLKLF